MLIQLKSKGIEIGQTAKCSPQHFEILNKYNWFLNNDGYPTTIYMNEKITMHKFVYTIIEKKEIPKKHLIDHIDRNRTNACIDNFRIFTKTQNARNKRKRDDASSKMFGVKYNAKTQLYIAGFNFNSKSIHLGYYKTEDEAVIAYDTYIFKNNFLNEGYNLNYPDRIDFYKNNPVFSKKEKKNIYNGVSFSKACKKYVARLRKNNKTFIIHYSENEKECAEKYDDFIVKNNFDKKLNFVERYPDYKPLIVKNFKIDINDKYCKIVSKSGKETIIDIDMYDKIKYHKIYISDYARITVNYKIYLLHRYLLDEFDEDIFIDHDDGNILNNIISNLKRTDAKGNAENRKKIKKINSTNYTNVTKHKKGFLVSFDNNTLKYFKIHQTEEYAARDRDLFIMKNAPNSNYRLYFKEDWKIPGEIERWEKILK